MRLAVDAVGEVEGVRAAVSAAAPESQGPETARRLSRTGGDRDRAYQLVGLGIESVDFTVQEAEIAHQKVAAELAEIVRSDSDAPRSGPEAAVPGGDLPVEIGEDEQKSDTAWKTAARMAALAEE